jgi:hypothetical protein
MWRLVTAVLDRSRARLSARLVLLALAERADRHGRCWPTINDLCARTRLNPASVVRALHTLERLGELQVTRQHRRTNQYEIVIPEPAAVRVAKCDPNSDTVGSQNATPRVANCDAQGRKLRIQPVREPVREPSDAPAARRRFASAKLRTGSPSRPAGPDGVQTEASDRPRTGDGAVPSLIAAFGRLHRAALGQPYPAAWGRDGACLKRALRTWDAATIERGMGRYFDDRAARLAYGADVPAFTKRLATLLAQDATRSGGFVG